MFVNHAVNEIIEVWQQISSTLVSKREEILYIDWSGLLYILSKIGKLRPKGSLWGAKIHKLVKNCNMFLVQRLAERVEI